MARERKVYVEGNFLKVLQSDDNADDFQEYLKVCKEKDTLSRKKRLEITKQIQQQNTELVSIAKENERVNEQLTTALKEAQVQRENAQKAQNEAEKLRDEAVEDLEFIQKKKQTELMGSIVKVALWVILGVGIITTALYVFVLLQGHDAKIIESYK